MTLIKRSVIAVLVKHLSAWDEFWGLGFKSPSGRNVIDGVDAANHSNCIKRWVTDLELSSPGPKP